LPPFFAYKGTPTKLIADLCDLPRLGDPEEYLEQKGKSEFVVKFPRIADIPATIADTDLAQIVELIETHCTHMQYNIASIKLHRYLLKGYDPFPILLFAGIDSIQHVEPNFIKQLTEVLFNLQRAYDSEDNKELAKHRFALYEQVYFLVIQEYASKYLDDMHLLSTVYQNAKAAIGG
jgi:hypothetical protein